MVLRVRISTCDSVGGRGAQFRASHPWNIAYPEDVNENMDTGGAGGCCTASHRAVLLQISKQVQRERQNLRIPDMVRK